MSVVHAPMTRDQRIKGLARSVASRPSNTERAAAVARIRTLHGDAMADAARRQAWDLVKHGYTPRRIDTPAARAADPATSHAAADEITENGTREANRYLVALAVRLHPGCTSRELTRHCALDRYAIARRLPEAETAGEIVRGGPRVCEIGKRQATTWWPT